MIRWAKPEDLDQINALLERKGLAQMTAQLLGDCCLVGEVDGIVRGVIWAGVCESRGVAVVDYFAVDRGFTGLGFRLAKKGVEFLHYRGVQRILTFVQNSPDREVSLKLNERFGLKRAQDFYYVLTGETKEMVKLWDR